MFSKKMILSIYAETPMHPGSGSSINRPIDLPIQRERHTDFPFIQSSTLKGVLLNYAKTSKKFDNVDEIFGKPDSAELVSITDAKLAAFPVRTLSGVFGWITCPLILNRLVMDVSPILGADIDINSLKLKDSEVLVANDSNVLSGNNVIIEDIRLTKTSDHDTSKIACLLSKLLPDEPSYSYIKNKMAKDLIVVSDTLFKELVSLTTEVVARIKINQEKGTAQEGALWYEEYLPTDTLLYSQILISSRANENNNNSTVTNKLMQLNKSVIQIGGDETVGKGLAKITMLDSSKNGGMNAKKS
jgi:CRISPR-associated protein Cmr4